MGPQFKIYSSCGYSTIGAETSAGSVVRSSAMKSVVKSATFNARDSIFNANKMKAFHSKSNKSIIDEAVPSSCQKEHSQLPTKPPIFLESSSEKPPVILQSSAEKPPVIQDISMEIPPSQREKKA